MRTNRIKFDRVQSELNSMFESNAVFNYFSPLKWELSLAREIQHLNWALINFVVLTTVVVEIYIAHQTVK